MHFSPSILPATAALFASALAAPVNIDITSNKPLQYATSTNLNPGIYRDGGGGACVNGLCVIGFSDTTICNGPFQTSGSAALSALCKAEGGIMGLNSFVHNSFATFDSADRGSSPDPPTSLYDFGKHDGTNGQMTEPALGAVSPQETGMGGQFAIWPNSNMVALPGAVGTNNIGSTDVIGVFNALNTGTQQTMYNTLAKITITDDVPDGSPIPAQRIVPELFQQGGNLYGTYAVMAGHNDNFLYLFARNSGSGIGPTNIQVARVPQNQIANTGAYTYWDGGNWASQPPATTDTSAAIVQSSGFIDTGEFFWSTHFNCFCHVSAAYGGFQIQYSDNLTSGWSEPQNLYSATLPSSLQGDGAYLYAGHSYPDWDPTGKSLLLSWTDAGQWTQMAVVEFA